MVALLQKYRSWDCRVIAQSAVISKELEYSRVLGISVRNQIINLNSC